MSNPNSTTKSSPFHSKKCENFKFISFWSIKVSDLVNEIETTDTNARVTHHDMFVNFINKECFGGEGRLDRRQRVNGSKHDDLTLPSKAIEFKLRSSALKSLSGILREAKEIFKRNDFIYFGYFRKKSKKDETKDIKIRGCIYYLLVIIFSKEIEQLNLKALLKEVRKEEMEFTKEVAQKSGIDMDDEELYAVGNMINEIKLERKLEEKDKILKEKDRALEEKDKALEEKDKALEEKDKVLEEKNKTLEEKDKALEEKDNIINRLKEQVKGSK